MEKTKITPALCALKKQLAETFGVETEVYLFGSVARGSYGLDSDIDVLVLLSFEPSNSIEERVFDLGYDVELDYGVVFHILVYSKAFWNSARARAMPLHQRVSREGIGL